MVPIVPPLIVLLEVVAEVGLPRKAAVVADIDGMLEWVEDEMEVDVAMVGMGAAPIVELKAG